MEALFFLIPLALIFCVLTVKAFFWAVNNRQFENLDSAAQSILFDDDRVVDNDRLTDNDAIVRNQTASANSSASRNLSIPLNLSIVPSEEGRS